MSPSAAVAAAGVEERCRVGVVVVGYGMSSSQVVQLYASSVRIVSAGRVGRRRERVRVGGRCKLASLIVLVRRVRVAQVSLRLRLVHRLRPRFLLSLRGVLVVEPRSRERVGLCPVSEGVAGRVVCLVLVLCVCVRAVLVVRRVLWRVGKGVLSGLVVVRRSERIGRTTRLRSRGETSVGRVLLSVVGVVACHRSLRAKRRRQDKDEKERGVLR